MLTILPTILSIQGQDDIPSSAPSKSKRKRRGGKKGKKNEVITVDSDSDDDSSLTKRKKTQKSEGVDSKMPANKTGEKVITLDDSGDDASVEDVPTELRGHCKLDELDDQRRCYEVLSKGKTKVCFMVSTNQVGN